MVVVPTIHGPFSDGRLLAERDYAAVLCQSNSLVGFLSIRVTTMTSGQGVLRQGTTTEVVRWRISLDPNTPWDEGYQSMDEARAELMHDAFRYAGVDYAVHWADETLTKWISACVLSD